MYRPKVRTRIVRNWLPLQPVDLVKVDTAYRQEPNVSSNSATETYAAVEFYIDNWRWAGVPFYIRTGKRLTRQLSEIRVHLKRTPRALFASTPYEQLGTNVITLRIQPA